MLPLGLKRREPALLTDAKNAVSHVFPPNLLNTGQHFLKILLNAVFS